MKYSLFIKNVDLTFCVKVRYSDLSRFIKKGLCEHLL